MTTQLSQDFAGTSLSWGTMKTDDLYCAFMDFLEEYDVESAAQIKEEYADIVNQMESAMELAMEEGKIYWHDYIENEEFLIEALFDALDAISPEGTYFGAHEGDGADYGFWAIDYIDASEDDLIDYLISI